jgi:FkbM family methyltransferase
MKPITKWRRLIEEPSPLKFLASRLLWRLGISSRFTVRRNGYRIRFHPSAISAWLWTYPSALHTEEEFVASYLKPGDIYVDVGANIGQLALRAASVVGPEGHVVAIEAHPRTHAFLLDNVDLNGFENVTTILRAAGETEGFLTFSDYVSDDQNHVVVSGTGVSVPVQRVDDMVVSGPVALLKVDVEGFELSVLKGAPNVLARTRAVLFESWDDLASRFGSSAADVIDLLRESGFSMHRLVGSRLEFIPAKAGSPRCENLVALRLKTGAGDDKILQP